MNTDTNTLAAQLREYNRWRRGDEALEQPPPARIGKMLDQAADRLEQHGDLTDAADPNGSTCARLKWWKDQNDELSEQLEQVQTDADEWSNMARSRKLQADKASRELAAERALADRLAASLEVLLEYAETGEVADHADTHTAERAAAAWKEARNE